MNRRSDAPAPPPPEGREEGEGEGAGGAEAEGAPRAAVDPAALAELLASLAHDLRSPLGVVTQALGELRADFAADLTDEHRLLAGLADRGLLRLARIADLVALVAVLDGRDLDLRRGPTDLAALLRGAVATALAIEPRREVSLACDLPDAPCLVAADVPRLSRAVCEVLINALRHARGRARLGLELASGEARVAIEDDGQGVAADRLATLFRRLVVRHTRSGLGLGLSIAHDVVAAHGGRLTLEASTLPPGRPGTRGARFVLSLPFLGGAA